MEKCFYCGALMLSGSFQRDHFPVPERAGGTATVPACLPCHDMKDRMRLTQMDPDFLEEVMGDWPNIGRASRILLAKALALRADIAAELAKGNGEALQSAGSRSRTHGAVAGQDGGRPGAGTPTTHEG